MRTRLTRRTFGAITLAATVLAVSACSPAAENSSTPAQTSSSAAGFPLSLKHAMGTAEIPSAPQRVVTLDSSFTDAALLLGANVVGYTVYRKDDKSFPDYLGDVSSQTKDAVDVGTLAEPSLEKILDTKPDLILSAKVRHEAIYNQLSKIAPTVFSETTGPTWKQNIVLTGEALGKKDQAEKLLADYQERAKKVGAAILAKKPGLTYSYVRFAGEDTARLYSSTSFFGDIMKDAGIPRPAGQPDSTEKIFTGLSQEKITDADAGFVVTSVTGSSEKSTKQATTFESNPLWKKLKGEIVPLEDRVIATSVSLQGANATLTLLAQHFGVDPQLSAK